MLIIFFRIDRSLTLDQMAEKRDDQSKIMLRMCDFTSEPKRMLPPIKSYEKEPLVSLEEAVKPLRSLVPDVDEMVWTVKQNCQHPPHHLSSDESASIMLYTLEWMPRESSFYFILNDALRSQNRQELLPWFLYLRLCIFALSKLPATKHRIIYRGIKLDVGDEFPEGKTFIWWAFSSCSASIKVLEQFLGHTGHRTIFNIECDSAKDISQHSFYQSENEVLMYPARQFQVVSSLNTGNQLRIIQVKEIQPPFPLIHIPPTPSGNTDQGGKIEVSLSAMQLSQPSSTKTTYQNKRVEQIIKECKNRSRVTLRKQNLTDDDMGIVVREAVIRNQCREIDLSFNKMTSVGASIIAKALENNATLDELYLGDNRFGDMGVHVIAKALSLNNSKLRLLNIQDVGITDEGTKYIAEMLKVNTTLAYLVISYNEISDSGVQRLANILTHDNTTLLMFRLDENKLISDSSVGALVETIKHNRTLKRLYIDGCNLSEQGKERLRQAAKSKDGFELKV